MVRSSDEYWDSWEQAFVAELEDRDLAVTDVVSTADTYNLVGWAHHESGITLLAERLNLGPPPRPLFTVWRSQFWLRSTIETWLKPWLDKSEQRRSDAERRREEAKQRSAAAARRANVQPGQSGYRNVVPHKHSGTWKAYITVDGKLISGGYLRSVEDAARCADYLRWQHGFPPINFPDDFDTVTLQKRDLWEQRVNNGPRGITDATVEALRGRHLTLAEIYKAVEHMDTTRASVARSLQKLCNEGRIRRVKRGVYTA